MDNHKREYELEMARDLDESERSEEQSRLIARADVGTTLESEKQTAIIERRAAGIDDRLVLSYQLYEGQRDNNGQETFDSNVPQPNGGSRAYTNIVRQIVNDGAAQIGDLLFPNDDRNYGLKPVRIAKPPLAISDDPAVNSKGKPLTDAEGNPLTNAQAHSRRVERSKKKTSRMFTKVDSSLIQARYPAKARKIIFHGAMYGTGVIKGPLPTKDKRGRWAKKKGGEYGLNKDLPMRPDAVVVSPLDWFPDQTATCLEECRYFWERMAMQPADLEKAVKKQGYDAESVKRVLAGAPSKGYDSSDPTDEAKAPVNSEGRATGRYLVWERHGQLSREQLEALDVSTPEGDDWFNTIVVVCDGEVLKAKIVPYESDDCLYSVYSWDEDPLNVFGYGIPYLMQDQQRTYVSAWRMALDNGGLSAAPQVIIDRKLLEPVNGKWEIHGGKEWYLKENTFSAEGGREPFQVVNITQNLEQIFVMMDRAVADSYEVTGVTRVDNAQQGLDNAPVTLGATQIVQNNTSVSRRAQARRWDDNVTLGLITRFYDYFMQFEEDDDIKANMEVEPRGATVLLAKELTATNTMQLYQMTGNGTAEGTKGIDMLRGLEGVMQIPAGTYVESEEETLARQQQEQEAGEQIPPEIQMEERKIAIEEARVELEQFDRQLNMMKEDHQQEMDRARLMLEEATAVAHLDNQAQSRIDKYHERMEELDRKHSADMQKFMEDNRTKRDVAAAKINAETPLKQLQAQASVQSADTQARELHHKITTGEEGI